MSMTPLASIAFIDDTAVLPRETRSVPKNRPLLMGLGLLLIVLMMIPFTRACWHLPVQAGEEALVRTLRQQMLATPSVDAGLVLNGVAQCVDGIKDHHNEGRATGWEQAQEDLVNTCRQQVVIAHPSWAATDRTVFERTMPALQQAWRQAINAYTPFALYQPMLYAFLALSAWLRLAIGRRGSRPAIA